MKTGFFALPFLALLSAAIGLAVGSAFPNIKWSITDTWNLSIPLVAGCTLALALLGLWINLDQAGFKKMFFRKNAKYGASAGVTMLVGLAVIVGVAFLSNKPTFNKSFDVTKNQANTLSDQSVKMVENFKNRKIRVTVTAFFMEAEQKSQFKDLMGKYQRVADVFDVTVVNPKEEPMKASEFKITSDSTIVLATGLQEARVTSLSEEKITNGMAKILKEGSKKVYLTQGHGESTKKSQGADSYGLVVAELENNKFEVAELSLMEKAEIPKDANLIMIAGPKYDFAATETQILEQYVRAGGALLVSIEAMTQLPELSKLLAKCGITVNEDLLIMPPGDPRAMLYGQTTAFVTHFDEYHASTRDFSRQRGVALFAPNARTLGVVDSNELSLKPTIVAKTGGDVVQVKDVKSQKDLNGGKIPNSRIGQGEFGVVVVATGKPTAATVAANDTNPENKKDVAAEGATPVNEGKEIRVAAVGSAEIFHDGFAGRVKQNLDMFMSLANYLVQQEDFISIKPKDPTAGTIDVSSNWSQLYLLSASFLYPFTFLGGGLLYWFRRKRA